MAGAFTRAIKKDIIMNEKRFLFLQPHPSFFCLDVIKNLEERGFDCLVLNIYLGDWFFRRGTRSMNFSGDLSEWPDYLELIIKENNITDIVYYADQRPYHRAARQIARRIGVNCFAYEFGYMRPDFITLERGGMGVFSHFPNDPDLIEELAANLPEKPASGYYPYTFRDEAVNEVFYHLTPWLLPVFFPRYQRDRLYSPPLEYLSYLPKILFGSLRHRRANRKIASLVSSRTAFHVVLMQMQGDYQVRRASHYADLSDMIDEVLWSFFSHAVPDHHLVFKMHPLENALRRWPRVIRKAAARLGLSHRVHIIDGGDLTQILAGCRGVVLLNSTAGLNAILQGVPVKPLGIAIYDMPRLTHQGPLDTFWTAPESPIRRTALAFRKLLIASIQVKGNFFTPEGRAAAVPEFARRLSTGAVNDHGAFVDPPPRLARALEMGVPMIYED